MLDMPVTTGTLDTAGTRAAGGPAMPDATTLLTAAEAARLLSVSERTVRRWISAGELHGVRVRGPHGPEVRVSKEAVSTYRLLAPPVMPDTPDRTAPGLPAMPDALPVTPAKPDTTDTTDTTVAVLQARLDGALLAARLHAERRRAVERERLQDREEIQRAAQEVEFLRLQLQQRTDAERELRLLLASTQQAIQAIATRPALEAGPPASRTAWWKLWRRA